MDIITKLKNIQEVSSEDINATLQEAIDEIKNLRVALRPFAEWSNQISWDDIVRARNLLLANLLKQIHPDS